MPKFCVHPKGNALVVNELLDGGEDVVPTAAVEASAVVAELVEDLIHFERGQNSL
jgi:hypothetical protein